MTIKVFPIPLSDSIEKSSFVILITSYNNEKYARANMISALNQHYSKYRIIFINDVSTDHTLEIAQNVIQEYQAEDKVTVIDNKTRKLGLRNYYEAITNSTEDKEIIVCLDGDDFLANRNVLFILDKIYNNPKKEIWLTYGQYVGLNKKLIGCNIKIPKDVIRNNSFREFNSNQTHLRTFYSWLFKQINIDDLKYKGNFFEMTWDLSFMFPMLEMSGDRFAFINKPLYLYNDNNPINDHKVNIELQKFYDNYIRSLKKYKRLKHSTFNFCNENDCIICNRPSIEK